MVMLSYSELLKVLKKITGECEEAESLAGNYTISRSAQSIKPGSTVIKTYLCVIERLTTINQSNSDEEWCWGGSVSALIDAKNCGKLNCQ